MRALVPAIALAVGTLGVAPAQAAPSLRLYHTIRAVSLDPTMPLATGLCTAELADVPADATVTTNVRCTIDGRAFSTSSPTSRADAPAATPVGHTYSVCLSGSATIQRPNQYYVLTASIGCYNFTADSFEIG